MQAYFNGAFISDVIPLHLNDRGLWFGDGFFETMIFDAGRIRYLNEHIERITAGMNIMKLISDLLTTDLMNSTVLELMKLNGIQSSCRVKLLVWRKEQDQKAYGSNEIQSNLLIQIFPISGRVATKYPKVGFAQTIKNQLTPTSHFKTLSSLNYVVADQEKVRRDLDDLIICDVYGNLSECVSSNLFWVMGNQLFTPDLITGCINGIVRNQILKYASQLNIKVNQVTGQKDALKNAECIFSANVGGIQIFKKVENESLETKSPLVDQLKELLFSSHDL